MYCISSNDADSDKDPKVVAATTKREAFIAFLFVSTAMTMFCIMLFTFHYFNPVLIGFALLSTGAYIAGAVGNRLRNSTLYIPAQLLSLFTFCFGYFILFSLVIGEICTMFQPKQERQYEFLRETETSMLLISMVLLDIVVLVIVQLFVWVFKVTNRDYHAVLASESLRKEVQDIENKVQNV
ncbi:unnamed protein product [Bursaphelenchus okinawaensis]|uniref:Uncharacterized protein n=1 Tax=Bursaphelenchus okinawaensis TaxID=465554 RepID=A0A811JRU4_9BILA|nr:unnamed protein product [Bursaphelenchus okinawaensis]CAG9080193.1 unnamed protein product [Bursaphelenchus okinawaensis]